MLGGHASLTYEPRKHTSYYVTASRGYKAGGFNIGALVPDDRRTFEPEYLWNLETGLRRADAARHYSIDLAAFYMWRQDQQVASSFQLQRCRASGEKTSLLALGSPSGGIGFMM